MGKRKRKRPRIRRPAARPVRQPPAEPPTSPRDRETRDALLTLAQAIQGMIGEVRQRQRKARERQRAAFQSADATLVECIAPYTKDALVGMLDALEIVGAKGLLKAPMTERIMQELRDPERLAAIVARLTNREREALRFVLSQTGVVPSDEFARRYDHDWDESPYWRYPSHQPESVLGRLRVRGLLAEGTLDEQLVVIVPQELREPLKKILD